jgi:hypothetical protein
VLSLMMGDVPGERERRACFMRLESVDLPYMPGLPGAVPEFVPVALLSAAVPPDIPGVAALSGAIGAPEVSEPPEVPMPEPAP